MPRQTAHHEAIISRNETRIVKNRDIQKELVQADRAERRALHELEVAEMHVREAERRICDLHRGLEADCAHLRHENAQLTGVKLVAV